MLFARTLDTKVYEDFFLPPGQSLAVVWVVTGDNVVHDGGIMDGNVCNGYS